MNQAKVNALISSAYNIHVGPVLGGEFMTPAKAEFLPASEKAKLCILLQENGGSDLYSTEQAAEALQMVLGLSK